LRRCGASFRDGVFKLKALVALLAGLGRRFKARLRRHVVAVAPRRGPAARGDAQAQRQARCSSAALVPRNRN
jgi:hypothetical protein